MTREVAATSTTADVGGHRLDGGGGDGDLGDHLGILGDLDEIGLLVLEVLLELAGRVVDDALDVCFGIVEVQRHQGHDTLPAGRWILRVELLSCDCFPVLVHHEHADRDQRGRAEDRECHRDDLEDKPPPATAWRGLLLRSSLAVSGCSASTASTSAVASAVSSASASALASALDLGFGFLRLATQPDRPGLRARRGGDRLRLSRLGLSLLGQRQRLVRRARPASSAIPRPDQRRSPTRGA